MLSREMLRLDATVSPIASGGNTQKYLTRRANHRHSFIIAKIVEFAPEQPAAGFFVSNFLNWTLAARHAACHRGAPCDGYTLPRIIASASQARRRRRPFVP